MFKVWLILQREYTSRVTNKWFIITTLLAPIGLVILSLSPILFSQISSGVTRIGVLDESGVVAKSLTSSSDLEFKELSGSLADIKKSYTDQNVEGVLYIPFFDLTNSSGVTYYSRSPLGFDKALTLQTQLNKSIEDKKYEQAGLSREAIEKLRTNVNIETVVISNDGNEKSSSSTLAGGIAYGMGTLIYITLIIYGVTIMRGVLEEKTSRVVEIIISSVRPWQLMLGKIFGIALVGLTQFALWIGLSIVFLGIAGIAVGQQLSPTPNSQSLQSLESTNNVATTFDYAGIVNSLQSINLGQLFFLFIFYFLGGYFLYAALFAAVGSAATNESEVNSLSFPVTMPIILSLFLMFSVITNPQGQLAFWGSMIPLTSPIVMMARIPFGVPTWQIIVSMILLVVGFIASTWFAAKIYRTGILLYGKRPGFRELWRWIRA